MSKIYNIKDARAAARNLVNQTSKSTNNDVIKELVKEAETTPLTEEGFEEIGALLALPEDKFMVLGPIFLEEIEKSFHNLNDATTLAQAMNAAGLKLEDLQAEFDTISTSIDEEMKEHLSEQKRDFLKQYWAIIYNCIAETEGIAKKILQIPIEKCHDAARIPVYAHPTDVGLDVYATEEITINPGETRMIPIGLKVATPIGYEFQVRPRSGMSSKTKIRVTLGTIDPGYRGELGVIIDNIDPPIKKFCGMSEDGVPVFEYGSSYTIGKGERFAQLVLSEKPKAAFYEVNSVGDDSDRGIGGFGSSGK